MAVSRRALITGITGQDGSYLAELLLSRGYEVWGALRDSADDPGLIRHLLDAQPAAVQLRPADLTDLSSLESVLSESRPDEVYNLAARSHVGESFEKPDETGNVTGLGAVRLLEAVRRIRPQARVFQASSSDMFGEGTSTRQNEQTPFRPTSPYAVAKVYAHQMAQIYRQSFGLFVACGILFNHESPRRGEHFVSRKITRTAAAISSRESQLGSRLGVRGRLR
jgi:GDPmannose 4,6-dehydratase